MFPDRAAMEYDDLGFRAVDSIATTLYEWKPQALKNLLDLKKGKFSWTYCNMHGHKTYVKRNKDEVRVSVPSAKRSIELKSA